MTNSVSARRRVGARAVTVTAMFSAVAFVLMFLDRTVQHSINTG